MLEGKGQNPLVLASRFRDSDLLGLGGSQIKRSQKRTAFHSTVLEVATVFSLGTVAANIMIRSVSDVFYVNVRRLLAISGLSQGELARRGGFSQGGLSDFLSPDKLQNPTLEMMERYAKAFGVPLAYLLIDQDAPAEQIPVLPDYQLVSVVVPSVIGLRIKFEGQRYAKEVAMAFQRKLKQPNSFH